MSYGLKYTLTFREEASNMTSGGDSPYLYKVNIYKNGWSNGTFNLIGTDNPISLSYKKQDLKSAIIGSELTLNISSIVNGQYIEFSNAAPLSYYIDILRSSDGGSTYSTYWSGVNTTDTFSESYSNPPYPVSLKFNCGLGELQWHRYENGGSLLNGNEQIILTVANCLSFLPYVKNVREIINIREDNMYDTQGLLEQTLLNDLTYQEIGDDGIMHGKPCQKILNDILTSLNCRMYQSNNMWFIERIYERTQTTFTYFDYTPTGSLQNPGYTYSNIGTGTLDPRITINNATNPKLINGGDWQTTQKKPILLYDFQVKPESQELIPNPYFENNPKSLNSDGTPKFWDRGVNLAASDVQVKLVNPYTNNLQEKYGVVFDNTALQNFALAIKTFDNANKLPPFSGNLSQFRGIGNNYGLHAVRKPGDGTTHSNFYFDTTNGQLQITVNHFYSFKIQATSSAVLNQLAMINPGSLSGSGQGDAYALVNGSCGYMIQVPFHLYIYNGADNWEIASQYFDLGGWGWSKNSGNESAFQTVTLAGINQRFPSVEYTGQPTPINMYQIANMLANSWTNQQPFYLNFIAKYSVNYPLSSMHSPSGMYALDCSIYPVLQGTLTTAGAYSCPNSYLKYTNLSLDSWGVNTCSVIYKNQFANAVPFTKFYATSDYNDRWSEEKITPVYGDTLIAGYPEQFMLTNSQPTNTWHIEGQAKKYLTNLGTSGDPGTGKIILDNSLPASATNLLINITDANSINETSWITSFTSGKLITITDTANGLRYIFNITGSPVSHTTYYSVPISYASGSTTPLNEFIGYSSPSGSFTQGETITGLTSGKTAILYANNGINGMTVYSPSGSFTVGETLRGNTSHATVVYSFTNGDTLNIVYDSGYILADILFSKYASLIGNYRRAIRGSILNNGGIGFWQSVVDEDGTLYCQTSNTFNFKKAALTIDLEETSAAPPGVTKITQSRQQLDIGFIKTMTMPHNPIIGGLTSNNSVAYTVSISPKSPVLYPIK